MFAFAANLLFFLAASSSGGGTSFYNQYLNVPGFEAWKFLNLAIFIGILVYLVKKPLGQAFKLKREQIRAELIKAEQERQSALAALATADQKIAGLEREGKDLMSGAQAEALAEGKRLAEQTSLDIQRLREQAGSELSRLDGQVRSELRRFSAEESIRRAGEKLRSQIDKKADARLVKASIEEIGGLN